MGSEFLRKACQVLLAAVVLILGVGTALASSANVSYAYKSVSPIATGSLVSLYSKQSDTVVLANTSNSDLLFGIAVDANDSRIAVGAAPGTIQVASSGVAAGLVSNLSGDIQKGDLISVSPFDGIGEKALPGSRVIGIAMAPFNKSSTGAITKTVTDNMGKNRDINVGFIPINISVTNVVTSNSSDSNALQRLAKSLTGHTVSTLRVVLSLVIAAVAGIVLVTLIYTSIFSSIISIGRNPLAKYSIFRALSSVVAIAFGTAVLAAVTIFLLLR